MAPILEARGVSKRFQATQALADVDFSVDRGEVHALMGENGAGKSTLAKIFAGVTIPDQGEISFGGERVTISDPKRARDIGIGIVFQELDLFPHLSVADNIAIGNSKAKEQFVIHRSELNQWCSQFLRQVQLDVNPDIKLTELSISQVQLVAIARALSLGAKVIFFDEPTSSLGQDDAARLLALIGDLRSRGVSSVYVTHKMEEVRQIADRVTVMRDGRHIGTKTARELSTDELVHMMVGRHVEILDRHTKNSSRDDVVLAVQDLETEFLRRISFSVKAGEVLGVAGLVGSGRSELGAALFGMRKLKAGAVSLKGKPFAPSGPRQAINQGFCLLPEDRKFEGLFPQLSIRENTTISVLHRFRAVDRVRAETARVTEFTAKFGMRSHLEAPIATLSGGNQQKMMLARWFMADPAVLFLDEPTRGIDVGAKQEIYKLIDEMAAQGKAIILVSSELPELWRCCDRILVLNAGRQAGIVDPSVATPEDVIKLAAGLPLEEKQIAN
jgi:ABC-type sugar transport system ATPase subunit